MPIRLISLATVAIALAASTSIGVEVVVSDQSTAAPPGNPKLVSKKTPRPAAQSTPSAAHTPTAVAGRTTTKRVGSQAIRQAPATKRIPTLSTATSPVAELPNFSEYPSDFGTTYDGGAGQCSCATEICSGCNGGCDAGCNGCRGRRGLLIDFWLGQGYTYNAKDPANESNLPVTFNDRADEYLMNQLYLVLGREVQTNGGWDIGGRVDLLYGTDYFFTTAVGLETHLDGSPRWNSGDGPRSTGAATYGLAMPQIYVDLFAPIGNGVHFKIGHFYTTIGYESVMAPENFFYSHAYTMQYGEPFTHTGVLAEFNGSRNMTWHVGMTRGWDTWEDPNDELGVLGGFNWSNEFASIGISVHSSNEDAAGVNDRTIYSLVYTRNVGCKLRYIMQHDFGIEENAEVNAAGQTEAAKWYGLNQYLLMDVSDALTLGLRVEWFRDQDNARVLAIPFESTVVGGNYTAVTAGFNWRMTKHWTLRPEARWDWSDVAVPAAGRNGMFNGFTEDNQFTLATDLILRF